MSAAGAAQAVPCRTLAKTLGRGPFGRGVEGGEAEGFPEVAAARRSGQPRRARQRRGVGGQAETGSLQVPIQAAVASFFPRQGTRRAASNPRLGARAGQAGQGEVEAGVVDDPQRPAHETSGSAPTRHIRGESVAVRRGRGAGRYPGCGRPVLARARPQAAPGLEEGDGAAGGGSFDGSGDSRPAPPTTATLMRKSRSSRRSRAFSRGEGDALVQHLEIVVGDRPGGSGGDGHHQPRPLGLCGRRRAVGENLGVKFSARSIWKRQEGGEVSRYLEFRCRPPGRRTA